jgi:hypothetical protein
LKVPLSKSGVPATVPRVRIPPSPPIYAHAIAISYNLCYNEFMSEQKTEDQPSPLETTWNEAFERLDEGSVDKLEKDTVIWITARIKDPDLIAEYRELHERHLSPQSIFFLEMSEAVKRSRIEEPN